MRSDWQNHPWGVRRPIEAYTMLWLDRLHQISRRFTNREDVLRMATLTAWAFNSVDGAEQASQKLQALWPRN